MGDQPLILLVEDLDDDVVMIRHALKDAHVTNPLQVASDGQQAIAYLKGEGKYGNRGKFPLPALVLLDLNMPLLDGFEVLTWIRQQPQFEKLPVVVLTDSLDGRDSAAAYQLGAQSFLVKPTDFRASIRLMVTLAGQWLRPLPTGEPPLDPPLPQGDRPPPA